MRMWEAMLKGAKMGPQIFNRAVDGDGGSCAQGAIAQGLAGRTLARIGFNQEIDYVFNYLEDAVGSVSCPFGCTVGNVGARHVALHNNIWRVIAHLNNDHEWSRECIAYWLRDLEEPNWKKRLAAESVSASCERVADADPVPRIA